MNGEIVLGVSLGSAFATLISFGAGKRMTQDENGRVLLGAIGFAIALGTYSMWKHDFALFMEIGGWFLACLTPVLVGGVVGNMLARKRDDQAFVDHLTRLAQKHHDEIMEMRADYERRLREAQLARYDVTGVDRDPA